MTDTIDLTEEGLARIAARAIELYALKHPRPPQVTQEQAAEILGVSSRTVRNYIRAGRLRLNKCGRLSIDAVDALLTPQ